MMHGQQHMIAPSSEFRRSAMTVFMTLIQGAPIKSIPSLVDNSSTA